jgi:hypothetical protein
VSGDDAAGATESRMTLDSHRALNPAMRMRNTGGALGALGQNGLIRLVQVVVGIIYSLSFRHVYSTYIVPIFGYAGFRDRESTLSENLITWLLIAVVSAMLPLRIDRPSGLFIWMLYAFVFVPTVTLTFVLGQNAMGAYLPSLFALATVMIALSWVGQTPLPEIGVERVTPLRMLRWALIIALPIMTVILYLRFQAILSFAGLEKIYYQRSSAAELGSGLIGYLRTYYNFVIGAGLIAVGLTERRALITVLGIGSYVFSYMIDAQKAALIIPLWMFIVYFVSRFTMNWTNLYTGGLTVFVLIASTLGYSATFTRYLIDLVLVRSIAIPAQGFTQYHDFFAKMGHTWWSNVKGIGLIVPRPEAFASESNWPNLGLLIGREYYGINSKMNANSNLFAGEGVAAAGALGVLVIGALLAIWLRQMDRASQSHTPLFALLICAPMAFCLTNSHLSTLLLSFGGFFWLTYFVLGRGGPGPERTE